MISETPQQDRPDPVPRQGPFSLSSQDASPIDTQVLPPIPEEQHATLMRWQASLQILAAEVVANKGMDQWETKTQHQRRGCDRTRVPCEPLYQQGPFSLHGSIFYGPLRATLRLTTAGK